MPILADELTVWDISFRWAGYDPRKFYFRIPLEVEDNFRNLLKAILTAEIDCLNISLEKRVYENDEKQYSIYHWLDDIYSCMHGINNNKKLLRWASIERSSFALWCERMNILPLPQFWFPKGWNTEYQLPENEFHPGHWYITKDWSREQLDEYLQSIKTQPSIQNEVESTFATKLRPNQELRIACRLVAANIWKQDPDRTIASVINDEVLQKYCGANYFEDDTIREWIKDLAPLHIRQHRGRPRKNGIKEK